MASYMTQCCGEILESTHVHDFVRCICGRSFVDGGDVYSRVGYTDPDEPPEPIDDPERASRIAAAHQDSLDIPTTTDESDTIQIDSLRGALLERTRVLKEDDGEEADARSQAREDVTGSLERATNWINEGQDIISGKKPVPAGDRLIQIALRLRLAHSSVESAREKLIDV